MRGPEAGQQGQGGEQERVARHRVACSGAAGGRTVVGAGRRGKNLARGSDSRRPQSAFWTPSGPCRGEAGLRRSAVAGGPTLQGGLGLSRGRSPVGKSTGCGSRQQRLAAGGANGSRRCELVMMQASRPRCKYHPRRCLRPGSLVATHCASRLLQAPLAPAWPWGEGGLGWSRVPGRAHPPGTRAPRLRRPRRWSCPPLDGPRMLMLLWLLGSCCTSGAETAKAGVTE